MKIPSLYLDRAVCCHGCCADGLSCCCVAESMNLIRLEWQRTCGMVRSHALVWCGGSLRRRMRKCDCLVAGLCLIYASAHLAWIWDRLCPCCQDFLLYKKKRSFFKIYSRITENDLIMNITSTWRGWGRGWRWGLLVAVMAISWRGRKLFTITHSLTVSMLFKTGSKLQCFFFLIFENIWKIY